MICPKLRSADVKILGTLVENLKDSSANLPFVPSPFSYIQVDPNQVEYHLPYHMTTKREMGHKLYDWGKIIDGDWDKKKRKALKTNLLVDDLEENFVKGTPWAETQLFMHKMKYISERGKIDGCRNFDELKARYDRISLLKQSIASSGRLYSAEERGVSFEDDLFVSIGRNGELFFSHGGSHRLAICQFLKINSIPVRVVMRHSIWVEKCLNSAIALEHPDKVLWNNRDV